MLWNLLFGLCILGLNKYGDYISDECPQASYICPKICDVDHKHYPREECKNAKSRREEVQLYEEGEEGCQGICQENRKESEEEVLIRGYKNAKTEQESRSDTTSVQPVE